jgi:hypothetical protein
MNSESGPIALMLAVLEEATRCIGRGRQRRHSGTRKLAAEAEAWVRCDSRAWPFAFASICDVLGLNVNAARARLLTTGSTQPAGDARAHQFRTLRAGEGGTSAYLARVASRAA